MLFARSDVTSSPIYIWLLLTSLQPLACSIPFYLVDLDWKSGGQTFRNFGRVGSEAFGFTCWTVCPEASSSCSGRGTPSGAPAGVDQLSAGWSKASLLFWLYFSGFHSFSHFKTFLLVLTVFSGSAPPNLSGHTEAGCGLKPEVTFASKLSRPLGCH